MRLLAVLLALAGCTSTAERQAEQARRALEPQAAAAVQRYWEGQPAMAGANAKRLADATAGIVGARTADFFHQPLDYPALDATVAVAAIGADGCRELNQRVVWSDVGKQRMSEASGRLCPSPAGWRLTALSDITPPEPPPDPNRNRRQRSDPFDPTKGAGRPAKPN